VPRGKRVLELPGVDIHHADGGPPAEAPDVIAAEALCRELRHDADAKAVRKVVLATSGLRALTAAASNTLSNEGMVQRPAVGAGEEGSGAKRRGHRVEAGALVEGTPSPARQRDDVRAPDFAEGVCLCGTKADIATAVWPAPRCRLRRHIASSLRMPVLRIIRNMARTEEQTGEDQVKRCPRTVKSVSASIATSMSAVRGSFRVGRSAVGPSSST
jgi:hypothetical protein